jgi:hypothetical protein
MELFYRNLAYDQKHIKRQDPETNQLNNINGRYMDSAPKGQTMAEFKNGTYKNSMSQIPAQSNPPVFKPKSLSQAGGAYKGPNLNNGSKYTTMPVLLPEARKERTYVRRPKTPIRQFY